MPTNDMVSMLIRIPEPTHHALKVMALDSRMSLTEVTRLALQYAVGGADFHAYMQGMRAERPEEEKQK